MWAYTVELAKRERPLVAQHIVAIAALRTSMHSIYAIPPSYLAASFEAIRQYADPLSDHITELTALYDYEVAEDTFSDQTTLNEWCNMRFLNRRVLDDVLSVRDMVIDKMNIHTSLASLDEQTRLDIRWILARAFFRHSAFLIKNSNDEQARYRTIHGNVMALLAANSMLNTGTHQWVIYDEFTLGQHPYLETATAIDPEWIVVSWLVPCFLSRSYLLTLLIRISRSSSPIV